MKEIKVPELAESVTEGTIAEWYIAEGDYVEKDAPILELETDKVNVEINSDFSGVIKELKKTSGDTVEVGEVIATIDESAKEDDVKEESKEKEKPDTSNKQEDKEESSQSTTQEENKEQSEKENDKEDQQPKKQKKEESNQKEEKSTSPIASPAARKKARELGIDLNNVESKDPTGRIRTEDVEGSKKQQSEKKTPPKQTKNDENEKVERIKMSRRRQTIAKRLVEAQQNAAMLTTFNEVDMTAVMNLRKRRKDAFQEKHDVKLGFMSFFTKAVIGALKEFPLVNAEIEGDEILIKKHYDIGIAVSADEGLVVPVVRNADQLSFAGIEKEILSLSEKAKTNSLSLKDLTGGTFTITNGGIFGSLYSTPIINAPQVGILGMHTIQRRPVVIDDNDTVEVRPMMYIALSYDHRIIDGKEAVQFLTKIKQLIEDPEDLLLEG